MRGYEELRRGYLVYIELSRGYQGELEVRKGYKELRRGGGNLKYDWLLF